MEMNFPLEVVVGLLVLFGLLYLGDHRGGQIANTARLTPAMTHHPATSFPANAKTGG